MKKGFLAALFAATVSFIVPDNRRQKRKPQHYRALPETSTGTPMPVVKTPPMTEADAKRVKQRHRQRKAKRGY
jgi:hypothetical protein